MELQRAAIAIVTIFICYCIVAYRFQKLAISKDLQDANLEYTSFDESSNKQGKDFWETIHPGFQCPPEHLSRVGKSGDGGKWTCGLTHFGQISENEEENCLVYSFGVSGDSSFEAEILTNTKCSLFAYDPTVNQIAKPLVSSNPRVHFKKMGIKGKNEGNFSTLKTIMTENGNHKWIDILKIDVEGSEYLAFENIFQDFDEIPFGQLLIEMHLYKWDSQDKGKAVGLIKNLEGKGMRMFYKEVNALAPKCCSEFSFINIKALEKFMEMEYIDKSSQKS